jgi:hypothetical protein
LVIGKRIYFKYSEFFEEIVEVFVAEDDEQKKLLYRATLLGKALGFDNNRVSLSDCSGPTMPYAYLDRNVPLQEKGLSPRGLLFHRL